MTTKSDNGVSKYNNYGLLLVRDRSPCSQQQDLSKVPRRTSPINDFNPNIMLVPSYLKVERSQQRIPRMAAKVPFLTDPRGKKPRRILRLSDPREQQKLKH
ncbi:hypothetical protein PoB_001838500 [Plakobranchus ocellatus]|uniref:Uncharacterized protein n=1 Tax=Plakobranchus ocellatus TaxID=259542 RepID=A0AAV3Z8M7_9GAST|nr:hypothetical protein PoB_001838500 [Plakobranchus ocellatus]